MKKLIFAILFFLNLSFSRGQSYEGTLTYKAEYKFDISPEMKKMGVTEEILIEKMKKEGAWSDSIRICYKGDNYITYTGFSPQSYSIYRGNTNKIYSLQENDTEGICTVIDASFDLEEHITGVKPVIGKTDTVVEINGWKCEQVHVEWKAGTYDYYFHPGTFEIDPTLYSNHIYDGWAGYLKIAHVLPVKIVKTMKGMGTLTLTLSSYNTEKVDDQLFTIPELIPDPDLNIIKVANRELMRVKK